MFQTGDEKRFNLELDCLEAESLPPDRLAVYFVFNGDRIYNSPIY